MPSRTGGSQTRPDTPTPTSAAAAGGNGADPATARAYRTNDDVGLAHDPAFHGVFYGYLAGDNRKGQLALVSCVVLGAQPDGKRVRSFPVSDLCLWRQPASRAERKPALEAEALPAALPTESRPPKAAPQPKTNKKVSR